MPRINVEDRLWSDDRFLALVEKCGNRAEAAGSILLAFRLAQEFWIPDKRRIDANRFQNLSNSQAMLEVGLASVDPDGSVYVRGTEEQFKWWFDRQAAGRKGGLAPKGGLNRSERAKNDAEAKLINTQAKPSKANQHSSKTKQNEPSSSSSSSSSKTKTLIPPQRENFPAASESVRENFGRFAEAETQGNRDLLARVSDRAFASWKLIYPIEFIKKESERAAVWIVEHPERAPRKNFTAFLGRWLDRSFERERKSPQAARPAPKTLSTTLDPIQVSLPLKTDSTEST